jgi:hypothetical protein
MFIWKIEGRWEDNIKKEHKLGCEDGKWIDVGRVSGPWPQAALILLVLGQI